MHVGLFLGWLLKNINFGRVGKIGVVSVLYVTISINRQYCDLFSRPSVRFP